MTSPSAPSIEKAKMAQASQRRRFAHNASDELSFGSRAIPKAEAGARRRSMGLHQSQHFIFRTGSISVLGGSKAAAISSDEFMAKETPQLGEVRIGTTLKAKDVGFFSEMNSPILKIIQEEPKSIGGQDLSRAYQSITEEMRVIRFEDLAPRVEPEGTQISDRWPAAQPFGFGSERIRSSGHRMASDALGVFHEWLMPSGKDAAQAFLVSGAEVRIAGPEKSIPGIDPEGVESGGWWPVVQNLRSAEGRIRATDHRRVASQVVTGVQKGIMITGSWGTPSPTVIETGSLNWGSSSARDFVEGVVFEEGQSPTLQLEQALADLKQVIEDAREDEFIEPAQSAVEKARQILRGIYAISPRRYEVYPTPEGDVVIDGAGQYDRWVLLMVKSDERVLCVVGIDGNEDHEYYEDIESLLTDTLLRDALDEIGDGR